MAKNNKNNVEEVLSKIENFSDKYRSIAKKLHQIILEANSGLKPRLWYGMPGYAKSDDSAVLCFFREDKYISFGFTENAIFESNSKTNLMSSAWFLSELDEATENEIKRLVKIATK